MDIGYYFLVFLVVPLLVHLFNFRKSKKLFFTATSFIQKLSSTSRRKSKLKYLLLFAIRIFLFVALIVLIIVGSMRRNGTVGSVLVYYDNSHSNAFLSGDYWRGSLREKLEEIKGSVLYVDNTSSMVLTDKALDWDYVGNVSNGTKELDAFGGYSGQFDQFVFISDFQGRSLEEVDLLGVDTTMNLSFLVTGELDLVSNISVDTARVYPNPLDPFQFTVSVKFITQGLEAGNAIVKLKSDASQISSVVKGVKELDQLEFGIPTIEESGYTISITGDDIHFDNEFYIFSTPFRKTKVLLVDDGESEFLRTVFSNDNLFDMTVATSDRVVFSEVDEYDFLVFHAIDEAPFQKDALRDDAKLLVFPSIDTSTDEYEKLINVSFEKRDLVFSEIELDQSNPLISGVFQNEIGAGSFPKLSPAFGVEGPYQSVVRFRSGEPFLLSQENIYFVNSFIEEDVGFYQSPFFLPLMYQIAFSSNQNIQPFYYFPGNIVEVSSLSSEVPIRLVSSSSEVIPSFQFVGTKAFLEIPAETKAGFYDLVQGDSLLRSIAINTPKAESVMRSLSFEEIRNHFAGRDHVRVSELNGSSVDFDSVLNREDNSSIWEYVLFLVLMFILVETLFHRLLK